MREEMKEVKLLRHAQWHLLDHVNFRREDLSESERLALDILEGAIKRVQAEEY